MDDEAFLVAPIGLRDGSPAGHSGRLWRSNAQPNAGAAIPDVAASTADSAQATPSTATDGDQASAADGDSTATADGNACSRRGGSTGAHR